MNGENRPPQEDNPPDNLSLSVLFAKAKVGATVFGTLVLGNGYPEHNLCYSPSPQINHQNDECASHSMDDKVLSFGDTKATPEKTDKNKLRKRAEVKVAKMEPKMGLRQKELRSKRINIDPHGRNPKFGGVSKKGCPRRLPQDAANGATDNSVKLTINGVRRAKEEIVKEKMTSRD